MNLVVLKFGGTSLASSKLMHNAAMKVAEEIKLGNNVIVVVSAMAGVTDQLINLTNEVISPDIENYKNNDYFAEYASIITTGEQVSAGIFALLLQQLGFKARSWLGWQARIITDSNFSDAEIDSINFNNITDSFNQGYKVAVVCGFQGITKDGRITTLGRGGSDTSAIIIAGALKAKKCDIYTDVEGVFTSDPRIVPKAHKLEFINYNEMQIGQNTIKLMYRYYLVLAVTLAQ
jgi:aspartate kinase